MRSPPPGRRRPARWGRTPWSATVECSGPDNQITLWAATSLDFAQFGLREAATAGTTKFRLDEATAGTLGQARTMVKRWREVLGPDHLIIRFAAAALTGTQVGLDETRPALPHRARTTLTGLRRLP